MIELNVDELEHIVGGRRARGEGGCTRRDRGNNGSRRDRDRSRGNRGNRSRREGGGRATER